MNCLAFSHYSTECKGRAQKNCARYRKIVLGTKKLCSVQKFLCSVQKFLCSVQKFLCSVVRLEKFFVPTPYQAVPPRTKSVPNPYQAVPPRTNFVPTSYQLVPNRTNPVPKGFSLAVLTPMKDECSNKVLRVGPGFSVPPFHLTFSSIVVSLIEW